MDHQLQLSWCFESSPEYPTPKYNFFFNGEQSYRQLLLVLATSPLPNISNNGAGSNSIGANSHLLHASHCRVFLFHLASLISQYFLEWCTLSLMASFALSIASYIIGIVGFLPWSKTFWTCTKGPIILQTSYALIWNWWVRIIFQIYCTKRLLLFWCSALSKIYY